LTVTRTSRPSSSMLPTVGSRSRRYHRSSILPVLVNRGPSLANCSVAIVAAIEADAVAGRSVRKALGGAARRRSDQLSVTPSVSRWSTLTVARLSKLRGPNERNSVRSRGLHDRRTERVRTLV
jgi:hypothetical protein